MFKNRSFLYGLGIGLIIGAVLLQLMLQAERLRQGPIAGQHMYSDEEIESIRRTAAEQERARLAAQPSAGAQAGGSQQTPPKPPEPIVKTIRTVYITEQMNAYAVAAMFEKAGIVPDSNAFVSALREGGKTTKIRSGPYSFEENAQIPDIIAAITTPPPL